MKAKLTIAFDGRAYEGWRSQRADKGVRHVIEQAWRATLGIDPQLVSSSRTDSGVHARGLVAHAHWGIATIAAEQIPAIINAQLPSDIRIMSATSVTESFDARFDCIGKEYRYTIWNHPVMNPLLENHAWHTKKPLDLAIMQQLATCFEGRHDFRSFTVKREGELTNTFRHLQHVSLTAKEHEIEIRIHGDGFLYKMCRAIVGTMVQVGEGKIPFARAIHLLEKPELYASGLIAPAHGLTLWQVDY